MVSIGNMEYCNLSYEYEFMSVKFMCVKYKINFFISLICLFTKSDLHFF